MKDESDIFVIQTTQLSFYSRRTNKGNYPYIPKHNVFY